MNKPDRWEYCAKVLRVVDGDTIDVLIEWDIGFQVGCKTEQRLRFDRIDAPELRRGSPEHRAAGKAATVFLENQLPMGSMIQISTEPDPDVFGRYIADITLGDVNINDLMVKEGHAIYKEY